MLQIEGEQEYPKPRDLIILFHESHMVLFQTTVPPLGLSLPAHPKPGILLGLNSSKKYFFPLSPRAL